MKTENATLTINEIYYSIQGESTWAGRPCVFVRLTFCNLRCNYCDTAYAFYEGEKTPLPKIGMAIVAVAGLIAPRCTYPSARRSHSSRAFLSLAVYAGIPGTRRGRRE